MISILCYFLVSFRQILILEKTLKQTKNEVLEGAPRRSSIVNKFWFKGLLSTIQEMRSINMAIVSTIFYSLIDIQLC